jgi:mannobiose 2-epimerase
MRTSLSVRLLLFLSLAVGLVSFQHRSLVNRQQTGRQMEYSIRKELLDLWYPKSIDKQFGGFTSAYTYDFKPAANQDKMIVTQARHLWVNSKCAEMYPDAYFKEGARHGYSYLKNTLWDKQYGGFYTLVNQQGDVKTGSFAAKEAYGNSFGLYAVSAYYQATGDTAALHFAQQIFWWLEKNAHDPIYKGYYQHMKRDGTPEVRTSDIASTSDRGYKDQNTSIHLLESLSELYSVWPHPKVRERLQEMLTLIRDRITTPKGYLQLFFMPNWQPVSYRDSSENMILKHRYLDHVSFGHDVETAYLMLEASHLLGKENYTRTLAVAKRMVDHALDNGWDGKVGGFYDEGYYFKNKPGISIILDTKSWWAQAEGLNSLLMMSDLYPSDAHHYEQKFNKLWQYVQTYLIDHEHGDWYPGGLDKEPNQKLALKGQIWKATYHNFRALNNCIQRLLPDKVAPTVPSQLFASKGELQWHSATDNKKLLGYHIYVNGKRSAFTPLTHFAITELSYHKGDPITLASVDLYNNVSAPSKPVIL